MRSFAIRLMITALVTLLVVGLVAEQFVARTVRTSFVDEQLQVAHADATAIEDAMAAADGAEDPIAEAHEVIDVIAARTSVNGVELIDARGRVLAASDRNAVGTREDGRVLRVARTKKASAGAEQEAHESDEDLEYIVPVASATGGLALEIDQHRTVLDRRINAVRRQLLLVGTVGVPLALIVFFLLGGRQLIRRHASVVELSLTDSLTGLGNHSAFQDAVAQTAALALRHGYEVSLAVVDIDDFKFCNDRLGHDYGDRVLRGIAGALASGRREDACFRLGGDEFAVLLPCTDLPGARRALDAAVERARAGLPGIGLSIGISGLTSAAGDAALLREQADSAVYEAKRTVGTRVIVFDDISSSATLAHPERVRALGQLLDDGVMDIAFQPIWDLDRNEILGYEALSRPSMRYGFNGPGELFELAERVGTAHELCELARRSAIGAARELPAHTLLFLNVSPKSLERDMLAGTALVDAVRVAGLMPHQIVLELTEHATTRLRQVVREVARLQGLGFKIALDDVGAGNAGLELLCSVAVDFVKVDRSVVSNATTDPSALGVLEAVIAYASRTGATVIAEGIESVEQLALVREPEATQHGPRHAVRAGQGFLLGRPASGFVEPAGQPGFGPSSDPALTRTG